MSKIDRTVIRHLERLARIDLAPGEVDGITAQLARIVAMVEALQKADVTGVEPTRGMALDDAAAPPRADAVTPGSDRSEILAEAPDAGGEFFRVPRVIGRDSE